jgi:subtilisin family serine protease
MLLSPLPSKRVSLLWLPPEMKIGLRPAPPPPAPQKSFVYGGQYGSNYGEAVDIFAAGTNIVSASQLSDSGTTSKTGTSMASPHVAGLVSYIRGLEGPSTAKDIKARIYALATPDVVTDVMGSANLLAYNGIKSSRTNETVVSR